MTPQVLIAAAGVALTFLALFGGMIFALGQLKNSVGEIKMGVTEIRTDLFRLREDLTSHRITEARTEGEAAGEIKGLKQRVEKLEGDA